MALIEKFTAIAEAIREKTGTSDMMTPAQMPELIRGIQAGGGGLTELTSRQFYEDLSITEAHYPEVENVGDRAFLRCANLRHAIFPKVTYIDDFAFSDCDSLVTAYMPLLGPYTGSSLFQNCDNLVMADFPEITTLNGSVFFNCTSLKKVYLPKAFYIGQSSFNGCTVLSAINLPSATEIDNFAFQNTPGLRAIILRSTTLCELGESVFTGSSMESGECYIYVPSSLLDTYKTATNWSIYANQFRALESYTVDGTTTGELDESKI